LSLAFFAADQEIPATWASSLDTSLVSSATNGGPNPKGITGLQSTSTQGNKFFFFFFFFCVFFFLLLFFFVFFFFFFFSSLLFLLGLHLPPKRILSEREKKKEIQFPVMSNPEATSVSQVYANVNAGKPKEYWDYENMTVEWGLVLPVSFSL